MNTGINRIRLEFKVKNGSSGKGDGEGINRIRLEFKVLSKVAETIKNGSCINRIRLEFKGQKKS